MTKDVCILTPFQKQTMGLRKTNFIQFSKKMRSGIKSIHFAANKPHRILHANNFFSQLNLEEIFKRKKNVTTCYFILTPL